MSQFDFDNLPEGWTVAKLSDVTVKVANVNPLDEPDRQFHYVDISGVDNSSFEIVNTREFFGLDAPSRAKRPIAAGDILFSNVRTYLRNIAVVPDRLNGQLASTGFTVLRPGSVVLSAYVYLWVLTDHFNDTVSPKQTGSSYPATTDRVVRDQHIPLPPLAEQERIVAKVEALLVRVQSVRQRLAAVPDILKHFRQAVLAHACCGKLTEDWRGTDIDDGNNGLPVGWSRRPLSELCTAFQYGSSKKSDDLGDVPVLRMGNLQDGGIDWSNLKYSSDATEIDKYSLEPNTVLFNRTNSPELVGKTSIYRGEQPAVFAGYLIRLVNGPEIDPEYLNFSLNEQSFREYCMRVKSDGVSQSNINAKKLAAYEMPHPPLDEQQEIVRRVNDLFALAGSIEQRVAEATRRAETMMQSILARAFRGELVPTEADLAAAEGRDYETAETLMHRSHGELLVQNPKKKSKLGKKRGVAIMKKKLDVDLVREVVISMPEETFSFADIREKLPGDYDRLKDALFGMLDDPSSGLTQIFDASSRKMRLKRRSRK